MRNLTKNEELDIQTMRYFIPKTNKGWRITPKDRVAMADWSSRGVKPKDLSHGIGIKPTGIQMLSVGKTMRDHQITSWIEGIRGGLITKAEVYDSCPGWMTEWITKKLKNVPYDVEGTATRMWNEIYRKGSY